MKLLVVLAAVAALFVAGARADLKCDACDFAMAKVDGLLTSSPAEAEVTSLLENACRIAPAILQTPCDSIIEHFGPIIVERIVSGLLAPAKVCSAIHLCPKPAMEVAVPTGLDTTARCLLCDMAVKEIETQLTSGKVETDINNEIDKMCTKLPSTMLQGLCEKFVPTYADNIIAKLVAGEPADKVCAALGACSESLAAPASFQPKCAICELAMEKIDSVVTSNKTETAVVADLEKVCNMAPSVLRGECDSLVSVYGVDLINALAMLADPKKVCSFVKLCTSDEEMAALNSVSDETKCAICEFALKEVDAGLDSPFVETKVVNVLNGACQKLPAKIAPACNAIVGAFGKRVWEALVAKIQPQAVCTKVKLCAAPSLF